MITNEEIQGLQKLSRLSFSEEENMEFAGKLNKVVEMINQLQQIDCQNIQPLRSVCEMDQRTQEDEIIVSDISNDLFKNVPASSADLAKEVKCFIVPKVVE